MRASHLATALTAFAAGLSAATVLHRRAQRSDLAVAVPAATPAASPAPELPAAPEPDGVVLPFLRTVPTPPAPVADRPARCGDSGGLTKAGAPCGARATTAGRCHHHPLPTRASA